MKNNLQNIPWYNKEKPKDVNMKLVGLGNTRILIDLCPKGSLDTKVDVCYLDTCHFALIARRIWNKQLMWAD